MQLIVTRAMLERSLRVTGDLPESAMVTAASVVEHVDAKGKKTGASIAVEYTSPIPSTRAAPAPRSEADLVGLFPEADPVLIARFAQFHKANPFIYERFIELAYRMLRVGRKKYGAQKIIHVIRWDYDISTSGDVFEINNDFIALYARLAIADYGELAGFFELRKMKPFDRKMSEEERHRREGLES